MLDLEPLAWAAGVLAALMVGFAKTGIPGSGVLAVPLMALAFGGRLSVGALLPLLIFADTIALLWYRQHCQWDALRRLLPTVIIGMLAGFVALDWVGRAPEAGVHMNRLIGGVVLMMVILQVVRRRVAGVAPQTQAGLHTAGVLTGFATFVSNAAGPVMSIYLTAAKLDKLAFLGTMGWAFFVLNVSKLPFYWVLTAKEPSQPMWTAGTVAFGAAMTPAVVTGALLGRWAAARVSQEKFTMTILALAALGGIRLVFG